VVTKLSLSSAGGPAVQHLLGHASIVTTQRYVAVEDDEIRAARGLRMVTRVRTACRRSPSSRRARWVVGQFDQSSGAMLLAVNAYYGHPMARHVGLSRGGGGSVPS
jgi:hypothetical protein